MSDRVYECCIFCNKEHLTDIPYQRHYQRRIKKGVYWSSKRGCYYDYDRIAEYFTHK